MLFQSPSTKIDYCVEKLLAEWEIILQHRFNIMWKTYYHIALQINFTCYRSFFLFHYGRYDVSKITRPCLLKACTLQSGAVAAILYTAALCVNVSLAPMDDRLGPKSNGTYDALRTLSDPEVCEQAFTNKCPTNLYDCLQILMSNDHFEQGC